MPKRWMVEVKKGRLEKGGVNMVGWTPNGEAVLDVAIPGNEGYTRVLVAPGYSFRFVTVDDNVYMFPKR